MPPRVASQGKIMGGAVGVVLAVLLPFAGAARADGRAHAAPVPKWVDPAPIDPRPAEVKVSVDDGVVWLLSDRQTRAAATPERYARNAFRVDTTTGIETVSELHFDYDPSFEKLAIHFVHVLRGGKVIDALKHADWKVIQPESDMDKRIYSGELEGLLFLHDVRVGDVLDYAYTVRGDNPTLAGHFVEQVSLDEASGVADLRRRIVTDAGRTLSIKPHGPGAAPDETVVGDVHQYAWRLTSVAAVEPEDDVPGWYRPDGWVDVSDFASWNEVASAAAALFEAKTGKSPELGELVAQWKQQSATDEGRALAATRFVQDEIRYLGIEIGPHSHQPFSPATVLQRRFGDCKDKSLLLVTLLRAMGIAADPALVSTTAGHALDDRLPTPFAFDHAIVHAVLDGHPVFIDATASSERGPLVGREPPPYERALLVSRDAQGLVALGDPRPKRPTYEADETYTLEPPGGGPVQLEVATTFRGDDADELREKVASSPMSEMARRYLNYYAATYPQVRALADPTITDDPTTDVIVVHERYELPDFWKDGVRDLSPSALDGYLDPPKISRRVEPLSIVFPAFVAVHIHVKTDTTSLELPDPVDERDVAMRFHASSQKSGGVLTLDYEAEALSDAVPAGEVAAHIAMLDRVDKSWTYELTEPGAAPATTAVKPRFPSWIGWTFGGVFGFAGFVGAIVGVLAWTRRREMRSRQSFALGEAPTAPIVVGSEAEIDFQVGRSRCTCRGPLARTWSAEPPAEMRLGEHRIRAVQVACQGCGVARRLYFAMRAA